MGILLVVLKIFSLQFALQPEDKAELSIRAGLSGQRVTLDVNPEQWKDGGGLLFNPPFPSDTRTIDPNILLYKRH